MPLRQYDGRQRLCFFLQRRLLGKVSGEEVLQHSAMRLVCHCPRLRTLPRACTSTLLVLRVERAEVVSSSVLGPLAQELLGNNSAMKILLEREGSPPVSQYEYCSDGIPGALLQRNRPDIICIFVFVYFVFLGISGGSKRAVVEKPSRPLTCILEGIRRESDLGRMTCLCLRPEPGRRKPRHPPSERKQTRNPSRLLQSTRNAKEKTVQDLLNVDCLLIYERRQWLCIGCIRS